MSRLFKVCFLAVLAVALLAGTAFAAEPGSIVINQILLRVDAIAGAEDCTFLGPVEKTVIVACFAGTGDNVRIRQLHDVKPLPGGPVITGDFKEDGQTITWALSQTVDGIFHWEIHANDEVKSGDFPMPQQL